MSIKAGDVASEIRKVIQDDQLATDPAIFLHITDVVGEIAGHYDLPPPAKTGTVSLAIGATSVALPNDYRRGFCDATQENGLPIDIAGSLTEFNNAAALFAGVIGNVLMVFPFGSTLKVCPAAAAITPITFWYIANPTAIAASATPIDALAGIPDGMVRALLIAYSCKEFFPLIEDGADGKKPNTAFWMAKYDAARVKIADYINLRMRPLLQRSKITA